MTSISHRNEIHSAPSSSRTRCPRMVASLLIASLLIASAPSAFGAPQLAAQPKVVGYFYRGMPENLVPYSKLTHVIFSCARPTSTGDLTLTNADLDQLRRIRDLAHNAGIKVMIAIGEWGDDTRFFNATKSTHFNTFTNNIINLVNNENLDGVDIDWEYPENYNGDDGKPRSGETSQFTSLLSTLRTQWPAGTKLITAAIPSDPHVANIRGTWYNYLDWINIMDYDHENTFPHSTMASAQTAYNYWVTERGLSSAKFVLGVPFYGAAQGTNDPQRSFSVLVKFYGADPHASQVRIGGADWGYNGIDLIRQKTAWIIDSAQAGGGIMIWQVGGWDLTGENSLLSAIDQVINGSPTPLSAPTDLVATAVSSNQINLNWVDNSSNETGFEVDRARDSNFTTEFVPNAYIIGANPAMPVAATGLSPNTLYYFRVRATNAYGDSANSNVVSAQTQSSGGRLGAAGLVLGLAGLVLGLAGLYIFRRRSIIH